MKREQCKLDLTTDTDVGELSRMKALLYQHLESDSSSQTLGRLYLDLGEIYLRIRNYPLAHQAWEKASQCFEDMQSTLHLAETYYQHGLLLAREEQYVKALEKWQQALVSLSTDYRDEIVLQCKIMYEMGQSLLLLRDYVQAEELFKQARELSQQIQTPAQEAMARQGLAQCYIELGRWVEGQELFLQSLRIWKALGETDQVAMILKSLGRIYQELGDSKRAVNALKSCLTIGQLHSQGQEERVDILLQLADLYLESDLEQAQEYCREVIDILLTSLIYRLSTTQEKQFARVMYLMALCCRERQERKNLLIFCKQSMQIYQKYRLEDEWNQVFQLYNKFAPAEERERFSQTRELVNTLSRHEKLKIHNCIC